MNPNTNTPEQSAPEIPQDFKQWADVYADKIAGDSPLSIRNHIAAEIYSALIESYRHLGSQPIPSLRWVKASDRLPNDELTKAARSRHDHSWSWSTYTSWTVKEGKIYFPDGKTWVIEETRPQLFEYWEWLEESLLPVPQEPKTKVITREEAVAFSEWNCTQLWSTHGGMWYPYRDEDNPITGEALYEMFLKATGRDKSEAPGQPSIEPDAPINDGWISVADQRPDNKQYVLVYAEGGRTICAIYENHDFWCYDVVNDDLTLIELASHWRLIPKPPINITK